MTRPKLARADTSFGPGPAATRATRKVVSPSTISSPPRRTTSFTRRPATNVPFVEPRSVMRSESPASSTARWRRETRRSCRIESHTSLWPMRTRRPGVATVTVLPADGTAPGVATTREKAPARRWDAGGADSSVRRSSSVAGAFQGSSATARRVRQLRREASFFGCAMAVTPGASECRARTAQCRGATRATCRRLSPGSPRSSVFRRSRAASTSIAGMARGVR